MILLANELSTKPRVYKEMYHFIYELKPEVKDKIFKLP